MGLKVGSSDCLSSLATLMTTKGGHMLHTRKSFNMKNPRGGRVHLGWVEGCVGQLGAVWVT